MGDKTIFLLEDNLDQCKVISQNFMDRGVKVHYKTDFNAYNDMIIRVPFVAQDKNTFFLIDFTGDNCSLDTFGGAIYSVLKNCCVGHFPVNRVIIYSGHPKSKLKMLGFCIPPAFKKCLYVDKRVLFKTVMGLFSRT